MFSCSQEDNFLVNTSEDVTDVVIANREGDFPKEIIQKWVNDNPETFGRIINPYSKNWPSEEGSDDNSPTLRSSSSSDAILSIYGYDSKELISTVTTMFPQGYGYDNRIVPYTYYILKTYYYKKSIQVAGDESISIPSSTVMQNYSNMGLQPGSNTIGYSCEIVSSNSQFVNYNFITTVKEITHTISGQQIAPDNNPVLLPGNVTDPSTFQFRYQISSW